MTDQLSTSRKWLIALAAMLATSLEAIDAFILNVSLDHVRGSLSAATDEATWVLTAYLVASSVVLPFCGRLTRRLGQKRLFLLSTAVFTLASFAAGAAPSLEFLVAARILQGLGGGSLLPLSQTIMLQTFSDKERGMAMAVWGVGVKLGPIAAPVLGGWISDSWGWRWVFYINIPLGLLAIVMAYLFLPDEEGKVQGARERLDLWGALFLVVAVGALQLVLDLGQREDWFDSHLIVALTGITILSAVLFVVRELRADQPVIDLRIFRNPVFAGGTALMFMMAFGQHASIMLSPLFTKQVLDYTAFLAGLALAPGGAAHLLTMPLTGAFMNRLDARFFTVLGCAFAGWSMYEMSVVNLEVSLAQVVWPRFIQGVGFGLIFVSLTTVTLSSLDRGTLPHATGMFNLLRLFGGSVGIALVRTQIERDSQIHQARLVEHVSLYSPSVVQRIEETIARLMERGTDPVGAQQQSLSAIYKAVQRQALLQACLDAYQTLALIFLGLLPFFLLLRARQREAFPRSPKAT